MAKQYFDPPNPKALEVGIGYAKKYASRYCSVHKHLDRDNIESWAIQGAYIAFKRYDPSKAKWSTCLCTMVKQYVCKSFSKEKGKYYKKFHEENKIVSLDELVSFDGDGERNYHDTVGDVSSDFRHGAEIRTLVRELPELERWIIVQRYFEDRSASDIAAEIGSSRVEIWRLERRGVNMLRERIKASEQDILS